MQFKKMLGGLAGGTALLIAQLVFAQSPASVRVSFIPVSGEVTFGDTKIEDAALSPDIRISPSSKNYGNVPVGASASQMFLISNLGLATLVITDVQQLGANVDQFTLDGPGAPQPPPYSMSPGVTIGVQISFRPTSPGAKSATVRVISNDPDESPFDVNLSGVGVAPDIAISPTSKNYGLVLKGSSSNQTFSVSNTGAVTLNVTSTTLTGSDPGQYTISSGGGAFSLAAGAKRDIVISFRPTALGVKNAIFRVVSNDPDENPLDVALTGTGVAPDIDCTPAAYAYGTVLVDSSASQSFVVKNTGTATLNISSTSLMGTDSLEYAISNGGAFSLAPGSTRNITIHFSPHSAGDTNALMRIVSDDADENPLDVPLSGTGVEPEMAVSPDSATYGHVRIGSSAPQTFIISNAGTAELNISATEIAGPDSLQFTIDSGAGPFTLAPGAAQEMAISFRPSLPGAYNALLKIFSNDADNTPFEVPLSGMGAEPDIKVRPDTVDFAVLMAGRRADATLWIRNVGDFALVLQSSAIIGPDSADFSAGSFASASVPAHDSTNITVTFAPGSLGQKRAALQIFSDDPDENPLTIPLSGLCSENEAPRLIYFYPPDSARAIAKNAPIQFKLTDYGTGIDPASLNVIVAGTCIVKDGMDQTSGRVEIDAHPPQLSLWYQPDTCYTVDSVAVEISCTDLAVPPNSFTAQVYFKLNPATLTFTHKQSMGPEGGECLDPLSGIQVRIPPAALTDTVQIMSGTVLNRPDPPAGMRIFEPVFCLSSDGIRFENTVTISMPYTEGQLEECGLESVLDIYLIRYSTETGLWEQIAPFNADENFVHVQLQAFCYLTLAYAEQQITTPLQLSGHEVVYITYPFTFAVNRLQSNYGNPLEYRFNWGDGTQSTWSADTSASHIWMNTGNYEIQVEGRCTADTTLTTLSNTLHIVADIWTSVADGKGNPTAFAIQQNYPNPFNPVTTFNFQIPEESHVRICIYDLLGKKITTLVDEKRRPGYHQVTWDTRNLVPSGVYICHFTAAGFQKKIKMLLVK